jgi:hypothetical protein
MLSQSFEETNVFTRGWIYASFQAILLVVITILVAIFYERGNPADISLIAMQMWGITPLPCHSADHSCVPAYNPEHTANATAHDCILNSNHKYYFYTTYGERGSDSLCNLIGQSPLFEREGTNLFSIVGIPFILVSAQVVATVFSLMYIRSDSSDNTHNSSSNAQKTLKKIALLMLMIYATSFLFIQNTWKIPGNNLFLVEIFLLFVIFVLAFRTSSNFSEGARHQIMSLRSGEFVLTIPLMASAVLATAGNTVASDITVAFFSLAFANTFFLFLEMDKEAQQNSPKHHYYELSSPQGVILLNAWLCLIPFIMHCSLTISSLVDRAEEYKSWALAPIVILLLYELLYALIITIYNTVLYSDPAAKYFKVTKNDHVYYYNSLHLALDFLSSSTHASIILCILGGAMASFTKTEAGSGH